MKSKVIILICGLMLAVLVFSSSCGRDSDAVIVDFSKTVAVERPASQVPEATTFNVAVAKALVDGAAIDGLIWEYYHQKDPVFTSRTRIIRKSKPYGIPRLLPQDTYLRNLKIASVSCFSPCMKIRKVKRSLQS